MTQSRFRGRALTAVLLLFTFVVLMVSGIVLYVVPRGRTANLLDWHMLLLNKQEWGDVHIAFGALFLIAGAIHVWLNRKPLANYLRERVAERLRRSVPAGAKRELLAAAIISALLLVGAVERLPPVSYLLDFHQAMKDFWESGSLPDVRRGQGRGRGAGAD